MNTSRRWLLVFAIVVGILVIAVISLVLFTKGDNAALLAEDSPQGTVQRYLMAVQEKDFQTAFGYLSFDSSQKITNFNDWITSVGMPQASVQSSWKATLGKVTQNGNYATVEVTIDNFRTGGLFSNSQYSQQLAFMLTKTGSSWLITAPTYLYWIY